MHEREMDALEKEMQRKRIDDDVQREQDNNHRKTMERSQKQTELNHFLDNQQKAKKQRLDNDKMYDQVYALQHNQLLQDQESKS